VSETGEPKDMSTNRVNIISQHKQVTATLHDLYSHKLHNSEIKLNYNNKQ
jgi:hypothetical protein